MRATERQNFHRGADLRPAGRLGFWRCQHAARGVGGSRICPYPAISSQYRVAQAGRARLYSDHSRHLRWQQASPRRAGGAQGEFTMATQPLMPKATAVGLVESANLSFDQVADFCKLHPLEVKDI